MSVLVHLCEECRHRIELHAARERGYTRCGCRIAGEVGRMTRPQRQPTWTSPGGRLEPLARPGTVRNEGTMHRTVTCDCAQCIAMYDAEGHRS